MARKSRKATAIIPAETRKTGQAPAEYKIYRTALYARISAEEYKREEGTAIENQISLLRDFVSDKPYLESAGEYVDDGVTGTRFDRPYFNRMITDMRAGRIDCIIVKDLSRLGRNYLEAGEYLEKIFPFFGVRFIAITDGYDNINPDSTDEGLIVPLKNLINDVYAKDLSKKISSAITIKQEQGKFVGSIAPYGYVKSPENHNKLIVDEEVRNVTRQIFQWKAEGLGYTVIARRLNEEGIPSPARYKYLKGIGHCGKLPDGLWKISSVRNLLMNPVYVGDMEQGINRAALYKGMNSKWMSKEERIYVADTHEAIVSRELFDTVSRIMKENKEKFHKNYGKYDSIAKEENLLQGLVVCGDCGKNMTLWRDRSGCRMNPPRVYYKYICQTYQNLLEQGCSRKRMDKKELEKAVEQSIRLHIKLFLDAQVVLEHLNEKEEAKKKNAGYKKEIRELRHKLERAGSMSNSLYDDYADGILNERDYLYAKEKYRKESVNLEQKITELLEIQGHYETGYAKDGRLAGLVGEYQSFKTLTAEIVHAFIRKIHVFGDNRIEIEYMFEDELKDILDVIRVRKGRTE